MSELQGWIIIYLVIGMWATSRTARAGMDIDLLCALIWPIMIVGGLIMKGLR